MDVGQSMGLCLNISKCELITDPSTLISDPLLQLFQRLSVTDASLRGAPLFQGPILDKRWNECCADLIKAVDRLSLIIIIIQHLYSAIMSYADTEAL